MLSVTFLFSLFGFLFSTFFTFYCNSIIFITLHLQSQRDLGREFQRLQGSNRVASRCEHVPLYVIWLVEKEFIFVSEKKVSLYSCLRMKTISTFRLCCMCVVICDTDHTLAATDHSALYVEIMSLTAWIFECDNASIKLCIGLGTNTTWLCFKRKIIVS